MAVSPESILLLAERARAGGHAFIMNLSAPFVSQFYKEPLQKMLPYVDVLFGNESVSMTILCLLLIFLMTRLCSRVLPYCLFVKFL